MSNILINIIISSLKLSRFFWNKIPVLTQLVTTWCTYTKLKMPYLNFTVLWYCGNFLDKRKLKYLIKQTLHVHFVEPINWLRLCLSYNWIIQSLKTVSAIFFYQQMIALEKIRQVLFIDLSKKLFFILKIFKFFYFSDPYFLPAFSWEDDRN